MKLQQKVAAATLAAVHVEVMEVRVATAAVLPIVICHPQLDLFLSLFRL